jgi:membrane protease YdiL (CAAX protease family)
MNDGDCCNCRGKHETADCKRRSLRRCPAHSATAGFCEEVIYRGYLQKQFHAFSRSVAFALLAQALCFGVVHIYQGYKNVIVVSVLGLLYGALAQWRGNLRSAILAHAWSNMFEGYFKFLLPISLR